jgi:hypothetical protein
MSRARLPIANEIVAPLTPWLHGNFFVKRLEHYEEGTTTPAKVFVSLQASFELHDAPQLPLKTLDESWRDTKNYIASACALIQRDSPRRSLSATERKTVLAALGEPPPPAWPLYFVSVDEYPNERIVYIGKTDSTRHRFSNGHRAITALHRPEYRGLRTRLYLATVTIFSTGDNYVPLEWMHPRALRNAICLDVEAQLIFHFQPELNDYFKRRDGSKRPLRIELYNYSGTESFDATGIEPRRVVEEDEWLPLMV